MIESQKNSLTELMREQLRHLTLDFTSINTGGKILYLGTPQSVDSIYNNLPDRRHDIQPQMKKVFMVNILHHSSRKD